MALHDIAHVVLDAMAGVNSMHLLGSFHEFPMEFLVDCAEGLVAIQPCDPTLILLYVRELLLLAAAVRRPGSSSLLAPLHEPLETREVAANIDARHDASERGWEGLPDGGGEAKGGWLDRLPVHILKLTTTRAHVRTPKIIGAWQWVIVTHVATRHRYNIARIIMPLPT